MADLGAWGWQGLFQRALEFPSAVIPGVFTGAVSPTQRARIRYNDVLKQLEASIDGTAYVAIALGAGGASPFVEAAGVIRQVNPASQVVLGGLVPMGAEQLRVQGDVVVNADAFVDDTVSTVAGTGSVLTVTSDDGGVDMLLAGGQPMRVLQGLVQGFTIDFGLGFASINTIDAAVNCGIRDGVVNAFRVQEAGTNYLSVDTTNGAEGVGIGNAASSVTVSVADNRGNAFRVQEGASVYIQASTTNGSESVELGNSATAVSATVANNRGRAFAIAEGANDLLVIDTTAEQFSFGNVVNNPTYSFQGTGTTGFGGPIIASAQVELIELAADPLGTINRGKVYTKDIAGITELFYRDSAGNIVQLTSGGSVPSGTDVPLVDNINPAFLVHQAADDYVRVSTVNGAEAVSIGNAVTNPTFNVLGAGLSTFGGSVFVEDTELQLGERVGDPGATANRGKVYTKDVAGATELFYQDAAGNVIQLTTGGSISGSTDIAIADNVDPAFRVHQAADDYIRVVTTNLAEAVSIGNAATNPAYNFLGTGTTTFNGTVLVNAQQAAFVERVGDPGATANQGKVYTKDVAALTELFFQDSGGTVTQLTSNGTLNITDVSLTDNVNPAYRIHQAADDYFRIITTNAAESIVLGTAAINPSLSVVGRPDFQVPDNTALAFQLREGANNYLQVVTTNAAETISVGAAAINPAIIVAGRPDLRLPDNTTNAFQLREGATANEYITIDTTDTAERISFGERTAASISLVKMQFNIDPTDAAAFLIRDNSRIFLEINTNTPVLQLGGSGYQIQIGDTSGSGNDVLVTIPDNDSNAFEIEDPANNPYFQVVTTTAAEAVNLGNVTSQPTIRTQSLLEINDPMRLNSPISPPALAAGGTTNDYNPGGLLNANVVRLTVTAPGGHTITGLVPPSDTTLALLLFNISAGITETVTLTHDDAGSAVANRFFLPGNASLVLSSNSGVWIWYDPTTNRWRTIGGGI